MSSSNFSLQQSANSTHLQQSANGRAGFLSPKLEMIEEDDTIETHDFYDPYGDNHSENGDLDFPEVELVRSELT